MVLRIFERKGDYLYVVSRVMIGLLFFCHGGQKLFAWFGAKAPVELFSLMGLAGVIEFTAGLAIALGFFTRLAAFASALLMLGAYFYAHASGGIIPLVNKGELALLYFAAFLLILSMGARKLSLEKALFKKELF